MYNFNEINSLIELKEVCFYIKAINEYGGSEDSAVEIKEFLKSRYNLEISVSKLYLFVDLIKKIYHKDGKFPKTKEIDNIISEYISTVRKEQVQAEEELKEAQIKIKTPRHRVGKNKYKSSEKLSEDISVKKELHNKYNRSIVCWAFVISLFIMSLTYCLVGMFYPKLLTNFGSKSQEVAFFIVMVIIGMMVIYAIIYNLNTKIVVLGREIHQYNNNSFGIYEDVRDLNNAKKRVYSANNKLAVNGMELSDEAVYSYLKSLDDLDIKYFSMKANKEDKSTEKPLILSGVSSVISKREQDQRWQESEISVIEKTNINKEVVGRVSLMIEYLSEKQSEPVLAEKLSAFYINKLSLNARNSKLNSARTKSALTKNYISIVEKIMEYEELPVFEKLKQPSKLLNATKEEKESFKNELNAMFRRIEKAHSIGLVSKGQATTAKIIEDEINSGYIQGVEVNAITSRYELAKLYIKIYDELSIFDTVN